jgi:hypothetical protein
MNQTNIVLLTPKMSGFYAQFVKAMDKACLRFRITSVARDYRTQVALYAQGREPIHIVNFYRLGAGLVPLKTVVENVKVTWTLNSLHVIRLDDQNSLNDLSSAFDIVLYDPNGRATYDIKVDVNQSSSPDYDEAGAIGESVGLRWGGRFKNPDKPHFQDPLM